MSPLGSEPVVAPTWFEAVDYCDWLTGRAGLLDAGLVCGDPAVLREQAMIPSSRLHVGVVPGPGPRMLRAGFGDATLTIST
jgi:hypothetical protein